MTKRTRRPPEEIGFVSTRTDPESYAELALCTTLHGVRLSERQRGYVRDALAMAFENGELQGQFRAMQILAIARMNATDVRTARALAACLQVLGVKV